MKRLFQDCVDIRLSMERRRNRRLFCRMCAQAANAALSVSGLCASEKDSGIFPIPFRLKFLFLRKADLQNRLATPFQANICFRCSRQDTAGSVHDIACTSLP